MKILVIDDNPIHQWSARQTLAIHDLTIAPTYDEAFQLLEAPEEAIQAQARLELEGRGFQFPRDHKNVKEHVAAHKALGRTKREVCLTSPKYDAVLTDLLMPASRRAMDEKGMKYVDQEMPVGFGLVFMAVLCGARHAAVVTDTNHHDHPAPALLDPFYSQCPDEIGFDRPPQFRINSTLVGFYSPAPVCAVDHTTCPRCSSEAVGTCPTCSGTGKANGKDWGRILAHLLES
jgi:CheY-like chemotaxis protein